MTTSEFRQFALSFRDTEENPHFDRAAFKVVKKRIFATLLESEASANLRLSEVDQSVFSQINEQIYPVPNKWGLQGWTTFELKDLDPELAKEALTKAYEEVFKK